MHVNSSKRKYLNVKPAVNNVKKLGCKMFVVNLCHNACIGFWFEYSVHDKL